MAKYRLSKSLNGDKIVHLVRQGRKIHFRGATEKEAQAKLDELNGKKKKAEPKKVEKKVEKKEVIKEPTKKEGDKDDTTSDEGGSSTVRPTEPKEQPKKD